MDNKVIVLIFIAVVVVVAGVAYYLGTQSTPTVNNTTNQTNATPIHNGTNQAANETPKVNISAQQAQQIAIEASADLGFPAKAHGTPVLFKWTQNNLHTWVWDVPLEFESGSTKYGSFYVDAYTGVIIMNE
jgi:LAS superfamily LD-carboxypeptidase LdcB